MSLWHVQDGSHVPVTWLCFFALPAGTHEVNSSVHITCRRTSRFTKKSSSLGTEVKQKWLNAWCVSTEAVAEQHKHQQPDRPQPSSVARQPKSSGSHVTCLLGKLRQETIGKPRQTTRLIRPSCVLIKPRGRSCPSIREPSAWGRPIAPPGVASPTSHLVGISGKVGFSKNVWWSARRRRSHKSFHGKHDEVLGTTTYGFERCSFQKNRGFTMNAKVCMCTTVTIHAVEYRCNNKQRFMFH